MHSTTITGILAAIALLVTTGCASVDNNRRYTELGPNGERITIDVFKNTDENVKPTTVWKEINPDGGITEIIIM